MTNFQNYLLDFIKAIPFGLLSAILIFIRKPTVPNTGWYICFILIPIVMIILGCLVMRSVDQWLEKRSKKAFDKMLRERQVLQEARKPHPPPNNHDGPEAA